MAGKLCSAGFGLQSLHQPIILFKATLFYEKQYTSPMHIIDRKWIGLAAGYQAIRSLQARLDAEFGRALQVGRQQQFRKEVAGWQKKRRIFFAFLAIAPLSILGLCLAADYFREVACVIIYWIILVLIILVTLAVAGRSYILEVINRPELNSSGTLPLDLESRWWASLSPQELSPSPGSGRAKGDFLTLLAGYLPDTCLARRGPPVEGEASVTLLAPSGPWLFTLRDWSGKIARQDGAWKQVHGRGEDIVYNRAPDDQWLRQKEALVKILKECLPQAGGLVQGGVAFIHPKVHLDKTRIQGNTAAYGPAKAWVGRLGNAAAMDGFTLELQLELLDALIAGEEPAEQAGAESASAEEAAERLYQQAASELRTSVATMVK